jgi:hypothetical protein
MKKERMMASMKKRMYLLVIVFAVILVACDKSTVSVSTSKITKGRIEVDGISVEKLAVKKHVERSGEVLYQLSLKRGDHNLRVITNGLHSIDTTFRIASGESYIGINMDSGEIQF